MTKKYALVCCSVESLQPLAAAFHEDPDQWDVLMPGADDFLDRARHYDGYLISGSVLSVVEDRAQRSVSNVLELVRYVYTQSMAPLVGICFGAQAIAAALGGTVGRNAGGRFRLGVEELAWARTQDTRLPEAFKPAILAKMHGECIQDLPPDSEVFASSATAPYEIFLTGGRLLGVQGHPELDNATLRRAAEAFHRQMYDEGQWQEVVRDTLRPVERDTVVALGRRLLSKGHL